MLPDPQGSWPSGGQVLRSWPSGGVSIVIVDPQPVHLILPGIIFWFFYSFMMCVCWNSSLQNGNSKTEVTDFLPPPTRKFHFGTTVKQAKEAEKTRPEKGWCMCCFHFPSTQMVAGLLLGSSALLLTPNFSVFYKLCRTSKWTVWSTGVFLKNPRLFKKHLFA